MGIFKRIQEPTFEKDGDGGNGGIVYTGVVDSPLISGEAELKVIERGLLIISLLKQVLIPYADILAIELDDYAVIIFTEEEYYRISRLGKAYNWFYNELFEAYSQYALKAMLVEGSPVFETRGVFELRETDDIVSSTATIQIYEDCICALTPDNYTRRIPLLFIDGMKAGDYSLTVSLSTGEQYIFAKFGHDTTPFEYRISMQIKALREKSIALAREQMPNLEYYELSSASIIFPNGTAAPLEAIRASAPDYAEIIEQFIQKSKISDTYQLLKSIGDNPRFCVGIKFVPLLKKNEDQSMDTLTDEMAALQLSPELPADSQEIKSEVKSGNVEPIVWAVAFNEQASIAAVELALPDDESAATYLYRTDGDSARFISVLNRALESTGFRREVITIPKEELDKEKHALARMLVARTPHLENLRKMFAGRVIHSSLDGWRRGIMKYFESP